MRKNVSLLARGICWLLIILLTANNDNTVAAQDLEVCGTYAYCIDCLCCGPGTGWDGIGSCVPEDLLAEDPGPCGVLEQLETVGCVAQTTCEGSDCCGAGTIPEVDPTREADACYCVFDDTAQTDPPSPRITRGPRPTDSPTMAPSPGRIATRDPATRVP